MAVTTINGATQIRANSIGSGQVDTSIIVAGGGNAFSGDQSMGSHKLTNLAAPSLGTDAANKAYVDASIQGLNQKPTARAMTTGPLPSCSYNNGASGVGATLSGNANGALVAQDGVTLVAGELLYVNNQAAALQNGLYTLTQVGNAGQVFILTRHVDMDASAEFSGALIPIDEEGSLNAGKLMIVSWTSAFTVGTTAVNATNIIPVNAYTGSNGINVTGLVISPVYGTAINTVCQGNDSRLSDARTPVGTALASGNIWVGSGGSVAASVAMSGDVTISNTGVASVANQVKLAKYIRRETPAGTVNGSNVTFTLANTPVSGSEDVFVNGILQDSGAGNDYTIAGATITFLTGAIPQSGDKVRVSYIST